MNEKIVLITGARKGIGRYLAEKYCSRDCCVIGCSRSKSDFTHANYKHYELDVTDEAAIKAMFREIRKIYGKVDILINNAGVASMNHTAVTPWSTYRNLLDTNLGGTFLLCREVARVMRKSGGSIVNFTSVAVPLNLEGEALYASSKAAIEQFTKILAKEYSHMGIRVNAIGPNPIKTDLIRVLPKEKVNDLIQKQSIKRLGDFGDVWNVIDFFTRDQSSAVTGQTIYLGGIF